MIFQIELAQILNYCKLTAYHHLSIFQDRVFSISKIDICNLSKCLCLVLQTGN